MLSYELNIEGKDLLVDPGTYCYTGNPVQRNKFRSVRNHNTLNWLNIEPCSLEKGLFTLKEEGKLTIEDYKVDSDFSYVSALYSYNKRFHRRKVFVDTKNKKIIINDLCSHDNATISFF